jgi:hypothetical protein
MEIFKVGLIIAVGIGFLFAFLRFPRQLFLYYILVKPVIDRFAEMGASVGGVSLGYHYIAALVIPAVSLIYVIINRCNIFLLPHKTLLIGYMGLNLFSFIIEGDHSLTVAGFFIRVIFPLFLFFSIPFILSQREHVLKFIRYSAISGIFPCAMIVLQRVGFIAHNREAEGIGDTIYARATGGYADAFSVALPIVISIFCLYFLIQNSREKGESSKFFWLLLVVYLVCLVFTFHRMTFIVVMLITALWSIINRKMGVILLVSGLVIVSLPVLANFVPNFFSDLLVTEWIGGSSADPKIAVSDQTFHGRFGLWRRYLEIFEQSSQFEKIFGIMMAGRAPHNDFLRILITNGLMGLSVYLALLFASGLRLMHAFYFFRRNGEQFMTQCVLTALFFFLFYVLGSFTLAISLLSSISWYLWIFAGIAYFQLSKYRSEASRLSKGPLHSLFPSQRFVSKT